MFLTFVYVARGIWFGPISVELFVVFVPFDTVERLHIGWRVMKVIVVSTLIVVIKAVFVLPIKLIVALESRTLSTEFILRYNDFL